jgi:hypothetical protein
MKYFKDVPLAVPVIVTFDNNNRIQGEITTNEKKLYFHSNSRAGCGPKYKGFKCSWTFDVLSKERYTDNVKKIELVTPLTPVYEIY